MQKNLCLLPSFAALASMIALMTTPLSLAAVVADTTPSTAAASTAPTVVNKSDGNALRMDVTSAIANYVNKAREANIMVAWSVLAETPELRVLGTSVEPVDIDINNADLESKSWIQKVKPGLKNDTLSKALGLEKLEDIDEKRKPILPKRYETNLQNAPGPTSNDKIAGLLDHYALRAILRSAGIRFRVVVSGAPVQGGEERRYDHEIHWKIRLYPIDRGGFTLYRATIKAQLGRTQTFTFPFASSTNANIAVTAAFKPSSTTIGLPTEVAAGNGSIQISAPAADSPINVPSVSGSSTIEGVLSFIGGVQLQDVINSQLFNPKSQGRLFYGGLIGQGQIKQLVGVNQLLASTHNSVAAGILLGIAPDRNNALFIGPSLQSDALTLSVGAMAREKSRGANNNDHIIKIDPAITVSLDLSNLIGGKQNVQTIPLTNSIIGGQSSDQAAKDNFTLTVYARPAVGLSVTDRQLFTGKSIALRRIAGFDAAGSFSPLAADKQYVYLIPINDGNNFVFLARGRYQVEKGSLPEGFIVVFAGQNQTLAPLPPGSTPVSFPIGQSGNEETLALHYEIRRSP